MGESPPRGKRFKRRLVFELLRGLALAVRSIPFHWALKAGAGVGRLAYRLDVERAGRARRQLAMALGVNPMDADRLAEASYAHLGRLVVELAQLPVSVARLEAWVEFPAEAQQTLREAVAEGRGVILAAGHIGNWELLAQRLAAAGFEGAIVVRAVNNANIERWVNGIRRRSGVEIIERGAPDAARRMLGALRRGALLGVLIDQRTSVRSVHVPFFDRPASTPVAAAALALGRRRPVVVATIERDGDARHRIALRRVPLPPSSDDSGQRELTAALTAELERAIRRSPSQWTWIHDRWGELG